MTRHPQDNSSISTNILHQPQRYTYLALWRVIDFCKESLSVFSLFAKVILIFEFMGFILLTGPSILTSSVIPLVPLPLYKHLCRECNFVTFHRLCCSYAGISPLNVFLAYPLLLVHIYIAPPVSRNACSTLR